MGGSNSLGIPVDQIMQYVNIGSLVLILFCAVIGFMRGTKKSAYYMFATFIILFGAFIFGTVLCNRILSLDLSFLNLSINIEGNYYELTSLEETLALVLKDMFFVNGDSPLVTMSLVYGLVQLAFRIAMFLVSLVLSFTLYKIILDIVWLCIRPRKRMIKGKKRRPKKGFKSRLGGFGIGALKGAMYLLLIVFLVGGIVSIAESIDEVNALTEDVSYNVVITDDSATLVKVDSGEKKEPLLGEYQEYLDLLLQYKETVPGKVFGTIEINDTSIDEFMFDQFFKIEVDELNTNVYLRKEIKLVAEALAECPELFEGELSLERIIELSKNPESNQRLKNAFDKIGSLKLIKVAVPVALEVVLLSDMVLGELEDGDLKDVIKNIDIEELKSIDYGADIKNIGYALVDIVSLMNEDGSFDFLKLDSDTIDKVFTSISELGIVEKFVPIAISYVLSTSDVVELFNEMGIDPSDLGLEDIENWGGEFKILGDILAAFMEIGLTEEDFNDFTNIEITSDLIEKIDNFTEVLFTSNIIKKAIPVLAKYGIDQIPSEYAELIKIPNETDSEYWQNELKPLLKAALALLSTGILDLTEEGSDIQEVLSGLDEEKIEELAHYLSQSSILTGSLNDLIVKLVSAEVDENGNVIKEGLLGNTVVSGLDNASDWNEDEIGNIFKGLVVILKSGIIGNDDPLAALGELNNESIVELAKALSSSKIITKNLSSILEYLLQEISIGEDELEIEVLEEDEWTETELGSIFHAFKEIASSGLLSEDPTESLKEISDETINNLAHYISSSKFVKTNLTPIMDMLLSNMNLGGIEFELFEDSNDWTEEELKNLFKALVIIMKTELITSSDPMTTLGDLEEETIDDLAKSLSGSKLIRKNLSSILEYLLGEINTGEDELEIEVLEEDEWTEAELGSIFHAFKEIASSGLLSEDPTESLKEISDETINNLAHYISSSKFVKTNLTPIMDMLLSNMNLGGIEFELFEDSNDWTEEELKNLFKAFSLILSTDLMGEGDVMESLSNLEEETIDDLAKSLSGSKLIRKNLSSILEYLLGEINTGEDELEIEVLEEDEWTEAELGSIFHAFKEIASSGLTEAEGTEAIANLSDETIDNLAHYIASSKFLTMNLTPIMDMLLSNVDLEGVEIKGFEDSSKWTELEIKSLLKGARTIVSYTDDLTQIVNLDEDELDTLMSSELITDVLVDFIKEYTKEGNSLDLVEGVDLVEDDEWLDTKLENIEFNYADGVITITDSLSIDADKYYVYVLNDNGTYTKLTSSSASSIDLNSLVESQSRRKIKALPNESEIKVVAYEYGEIRNMFLAVQAVCKGAEINADNILANISTITEADILSILNSKIITETLICQIESFANEEDAIVCIPEGDLKKENSDGTKDRTAWLENGNEHGELYNVLNAITIVFNGQNLDDMSFSTDIFTSIEDEDIDKVLKSLIINETLIVKIEEMTEDSSNTIYIPNELKTDGSIDRTKWNEVNESTNILKALKKVFSGSEIDVNNISLSLILEDQDEILKSYVLVETIKQNIITIDKIEIPSNLSETSLEGWKNVYDENGTIVSRGEISYLLNAIEVALNIDDSTTIDSIQSQEIELSNIIDGRDTVLQSLVLSNTVKTILIDTDGISLPQNYDDQNDEYNYINWFNTYEDDVVTSRGEIDALLGACDVIFGEEEIDFNNININNIIANETAILKSIIITETIKVNITNINDITIPSNLSETSLEGWKNVYDENGTLVSRGEISYLLNAIEVALNIDASTTIDSIQSQEIELSNIIDGRDTVLQSLVLSNTVKTILIDTDGISLPQNYDDQNDEYNYINWFNTYENDVVTSRGEIDALLGACDVIFGEEEIDFNNININNIIANETAILKSIIITETIKVNITNINDITIPSNLSETSLEGWKNVYDENGTLVSRGEISYLLNAIEVALNIDSSTSLDSIQSQEIELSNIIDGRDTVLQSLVLSNTVKTILIDTDGISLPQNYEDSTNEFNYINWFNTYEDDVVTSRGEIDALLGACDVIFGEEEIDFNNININNIIANETTILKSIIITETIKVNVIVGNSSIKVPSNLSETSLEGWKNVYNENGTLVSRGEISYLLNAIEVALSIDASTTIDSISGQEIELSNIIDGRDTVLQSLVLSNTVKENIIGMSGIELPQNYEDQNDEYNYINWFNTYEDDVVTSRGEIDALLAACDILFGENEVNFDSISLKTIIDNDTSILKSIIITETTKQNILALDELEVPSNLSETSLEGWKNNYNDTGDVISRGEISYLLKAIGIALGVDNSTSLDSVQGDAIDLNNIISERDVVLQSQVLAETVKSKLENNANLYKPSGYNDASNTTNYINWFNTYENDVVTSRGEIDALLAAIDCLFASGTADFDSIASFNYTVLFDDSAKRETVLSSKLISETIIITLENEASKSGSALYIPDIASLSTKTNRSAWWDLDTGELVYFLEAAGKLLDEGEKDDVQGLSFGVDKVYTQILDETIRESIFESYILAETITNNFKALDLFTDNTPSVSEVGVNLNNNSEWYQINISGGTRTIVKKELWNLISSFKIILGEEYNSSVTFTLDSIFGSSSSRSPLAPSEEAVLTNRYFEVEWASMDEFMSSLLIQKIFEGTLFTVIETGILSDKLNNPTYGLGSDKYLRFEYAYESYVNDNPDSLTTSELEVLVEYDTKHLLESIIILNIAGLNYSKLNDFASISSIAAATAALETLLAINWSVLVDAFFASRVFRFSIAEVLNPIFEAIYTLAYTASFFTIDSWDNVKFVNNDYAYPKTKEEAATLLLADINTIFDNISSVIN